MSACDTRLGDLVEREVHDLHRFFECWFAGSLPKTREAFARVVAAWPEPFTLIDPSNGLHNARALLVRTFEQHGAWPDLSIEIRNLSVRSIADDSAALALYEEWHIEGRQTEGRLCSATLMLDGRLPGGVQWVHIHESSLVNQMDGDR